MRCSHAHRWPGASLYRFLLLGAIASCLALPVSAQDQRPRGGPGFRPDLFDRPQGAETRGEETNNAVTPLPVAAEAEEAEAYQLEGIASWYGGKFQGRLTANGETFDTNQLTAAHRELPFGTIVRVTNRNNGKQVVVRINDRGPFVDNRVIDLSRAAADIIEMTGPGIAPVVLEILHYEPESDLRTLQIASFSSRENARALAARLEAAGLPASLEEDAERGVLRVIIPDVPESEIPDYRPTLSALGYPNPLVRRR